MDPLSQFAASQDKVAPPASSSSSSAHFQLGATNHNPFADISSKDETSSMTTQNHALGNVQEEPQEVAENGAGSDGDALGDRQARQQNENDIVSSSREITQQALQGIPPATSEVFNLNSYDLNKSTEDLLAEQEAALVRLFFNS